MAKPPPLFDPRYPRPPAGSYVPPPVPRVVLPPPSPGQPVWWPVRSAGDAPAPAAAPVQAPRPRRRPVVPPPVPLAPPASPIGPVDAGTAAVAASSPGRQAPRATAIRQWLTPAVLRRQFMITEVFDPPPGLRDGDD